MLPPKIPFLNSRLWSDAQEQFRYVTALRRGDEFFSLV